MWFARKHHEYGCPMCGRLPKIVRARTQEGNYLKSVCRLRCPRKHISTSWYYEPAYASSQWKRVVDEYKRKDTK